MTFLNVYGLQIPERPKEPLTSYGSALLDASGEKLGFVLDAPKTGNIHKVHFLIAAVIAATDLDVRVETVDATTGNPTGTLWATNTNGSIAAASLSAGWKSVTLTADASVTRGTDTLAVVLAPAGSPFLIMSVLDTVGTRDLRPYVLDYLGGAWGLAGHGMPTFALEYSDGTFAYMPGVTPASAVNTHTFNSGSTPDELALRFTLPVPVRVMGAWATLKTDGNLDLVLYDGTTALATLSLDKDIRVPTSDRGSGLYTFASSVALEANRVYRLAVKPTSVTNTLAYSFDVNSAAVFDQMEGGQAFHYSERTDGGSWSDTTTRRLWAGLILDGIGTFSRHRPRALSLGGLR